MLGILLLAGSTVFAQRKYTSSFIKVPDVKYATYPKSDPKLNMMDIYMPRMGSNSPVIIWIHGGGWMEGDKEDVYNKAEYYTSHGFVFISVNYRLSPKVRHPVHVQDVADAIGWFQKNAKHYSANSNRIFLLGHSAGAQIASLLCIDDKYLTQAGASKEMIKGVILLDGIGYDIPTLMDGVSARQRDQYIQIFGNSRKDWQQASPAYLIRDNTEVPPMFILYAGDREVAAVEAKLFAARLSGIKATFSTQYYPKKSNVSLSRDLGKDDDKPSADILNFLSDQLSKK